MVLERFAKKGAAVAGSGAGGFAGGFFSSPTFIILGALAVVLLFFQGDIRKAFGNLGKIELPSIEFPTFDFEFPSFDFEFPSFDFEFPDFDFSNIFEGIGGFFEGGAQGIEDFFGGLQDQFDDFIGGLGGGNGLDLPPDVEDTGLLTPEERAACNCGTSIIQDIQGDIQEVCLQCDEEEDSGGAQIIGGGPTDPVCVEVPLITGGTFNTCTGEQTPAQPVEGGGFIGPPEPPEEPEEPEPPFEPPIDLPEGFEGGGPSFEGGQIFEGSDAGCNDLSCVLFWNPTFTASQAADRLAEIQGTLGDFDFGTNTGSGFGPDEDQSGGIVTGGSTLEEEEQKAACVSCELYGLNCPICSGTI